MKQLLFPALLLSFVIILMAFAPNMPRIRDFSDTLEKETSFLKAALPFGFGGRILTEIPCTCSGGALLTIGPPRPMELLFQPGVSVLFSFYALLPPEYMLGTYIPTTPLTPAVCFVGVPPEECDPVPALGTIIVAGTSLTPFSPSI